MNDQKTTIQELKEKFRRFVQARNWEQFHTAKNLSMTLSAEAAELMEHFLWVEGPESSAIVEKNRSEIEKEIADVAFGLFQFCNVYNIDLATAIESKLQELDQRYPVEKSYGRWTKDRD